MPDGPPPSQRLPVSAPPAQAGVAGRDVMLDRAKGLAIVLVVFGHIVATSAPAHVGWYEPLRQAVYAVHMPFFVYLSGLAAGLSGSAVLAGGGPAAWRALAIRRLRRPLLPTMLVGMAIVLGKYAAARVMAVDDPVTSVPRALLSLVWTTGASPVRSIWYAAVITAYALLYPPLHRLTRLSPARLAVLAIPLALLKLPALAYLDQFGAFAVFYCAGVWAGAKPPGRSRWLVPAALAFLLLHGALPGLSGRPAALLLGAAGIPVLHRLVRNLSQHFAPFLEHTGRSCFMIYLFNTICIGLAKAALLTVLPWNAAWFPLFAAVLMVCGLAGPLAAENLVLRRIPGFGRPPR